MKKYFLIACLSLLATVLISTHHGYRPHHSFVQGGNNGPGGNVTVITCQPNSGSGSVTAGNMEVMAVKTNGGPAITVISSTRVTTWINVSTSSANAYWYGKATSSGAETISVTISSNLATAVCGEYSTNTFDTSNICASCGTINITTTKTNADLVCTVGDGLGTAFSGIVTLRQTGTLQTGPNGKLLLGDVNEAVAGTYTCASNASTSGTMAIADFYTAVLPNVPRHR